MKTNATLIAFLPFFLISLINLNCGILVNNTDKEPNNPEFKSPIRIKAQCSTTDPGQVEAIISGLETNKSLSDYRLEVTIYSDGFERQLFVNLWPVEGGTKARMADTTNVNNQNPPVGLGLEIESQSLKREGTLLKEVRVKGLSPGLTYFWRVLRERRNKWMPVETILVESPFCPIDQMNE